MTRQIGQLAIGILLAALTLAGCAGMRPNQPDAPAALKKEPFQDEIAKSFTPPPVQQWKDFPPPDFPAKQFDSSQARQVGVQPAVLIDASPEKTAKAGKTEKHEPLALALECILENKQDEALRHLQSYDADTQELFLRLLPALSILSKKKVGDLSAAEVAVLHEQLYSLLGTLRPRTALGIGKVCFCEWVKGYGNYKPLPEGYAFAAPINDRPGEPVQLYVELQNFLSEPRHGAYETRLSSAVEIRDSRDEVVWTHRFGDEQAPARFRTQLHDWYANYTFPVPNAMPPGSYRLTIQVSDETNPEMRRVARQTIDFRIK